MPALRQPQRACRWCCSSLQSTVLRRCEALSAERYQGPMIAIAQAAAGVAIVLCAGVALTGERATKAPARGKVRLKSEISGCNTSEYPGSDDKIVLRCGGSYRLAPRRCAEERLVLAWPLSTSAAAPGMRLKNAGEGGVSPRRCAGPAPAADRQSSR